MKGLALALPAFFLTSAALAQTASPPDVNASPTGQPGAMTASGRLKPPGAALPPGDSSVDEAIRRAEERDRATQRSICKGC